MKDTRRDSEYIEYFCCDERESECGSLYKLTALAVRSFANCCDRLESHYGYTVNDVDLKAYEADMRYILDAYIHAEESYVVGYVAG